jgi:type II secretory pathway pseudopilin PulG
MAIIAILVAILIPNLLDAADRAKQRATIGEMRGWANAVGAFMSDTGYTPVDPGPPNHASQVHNILVPFTVTVLKDVDAWKKDFFYFSSPGTAVPTTYTFYSGGKDGTLDGSCVDSGNWHDYWRDLAVQDGLFICSPS